MAEKIKFLEIELPIINEKTEILAREDLNGKTIKIDLTRKLRGKSLEIIFKIKQETGKTSVLPYRLHLLSYFIRRMMRKGTDYVEDSFLVETKNSILRIKPFLITRKKVSRAIIKALRNKAKEEIEKELKDRKYEDIFSEIIPGKFQRALSLKLKKIYPLAFCDIRDIYVEKEKSLEIKEEKIR